MVLISKEMLLLISFIICLLLSNTFVFADEQAYLSKMEKELWSSLEFKKKFAESYLAETEIEPRLTEDEYKKMLKVRDYFDANDLDKATEFLKKNMNDASSAVFDFTLANIYLQTEKLNEAARCYRRAVVKHDKFRRAWKNLGLIHVRNGEFKQAIEALTHVIELGGSDSITFAQLGYAYLSVDNNLCAESAYRMAVLLDPNTRDWKIMLAMSILKQERYPEAVSLFENLIRENPDDTNLWLYQANAYLGLNQPLKAAINYEIVDSLGGSTAETLQKLGDIYTNQELFETAVNSYIQAIEKDPDKNDTEHFITVAKLLIFHGALQETKRLIERIEFLKGADPNQTYRKDLLKLRAQIAMAEGAGDEQVKVLEEIVALDPLDGQALILLGQHYNRSGDIEKAIFYYERAESLEKFEAEAKLRHAQLLVGQGKYAEALPLLNRAQELNRRDDVQKFLEQVERFAKSR